MGALHHMKLSGLGADVVGVVDPQLSPPNGGPGSGPAVLSWGQATGLRPDFWDICVPTSAHGSVLARICAGQAEANVLVEKPLCTPADVPAVRELLNAHAGRITVGEQYLSSAVLARVADAVARLGLAPHRVTVELSKHRGHDVLQGRFQDADLGALGYEGPHLVAVVAGLGERIGLDLMPYEPYGATEVRFHAAVPGRGGVPTQDGVEVRYRGRSACEVVLYSSMTGHIGHPDLRADGPALAVSGIGPHSATRYRAMCVEGPDPHGRCWQVTGAFEPIPDLPRNHGTVTVRRTGEPVIRRHVVPDDSLGSHLAHSLAHFEGRRPSPAPPEPALEQLALLHNWTDRADRAGTTTASQPPLPLGVPA